MASSSSNFALFHEDDQTDEGFFDKLVDDDGFGVGGTATVHSDGGLRLSKNNEVSKVEDLGVAAPMEDLGPAVDIKSSDMASKASTFEKVEPPEDGQVEVVAPELGSTSSSIEKGDEKDDVKDWIAFANAGGQDDLVGFGSHSDFVPEGSNGFSEKVMANPNSNDVIEENAVNDPSTCFGNMKKQGDQVWGEQSSSLQQKDGQLCDEVSEQSSSFQQQGGQASLDANDPVHWESLYPGWKYDSDAGQWYQVGSYVTNSDVQVNGYGVDDLSTQLDGLGSSFDGKKESSRSIISQLADNAQTVAARENAYCQNSNISYLQQQAVQSATENIAEGSTASAPSWNYASSQETTEYPANMIFDPQYPGWYYDTNTQQWQTLETYIQSVQMTTSNQTTSINSGTPGSYSEQNHSMYDNGVGQFDNQILAGQNRQVCGDSGGSFSGYTQQNLWQHQPADVQGSLVGFSGNQQKLNSYDQTYLEVSHTEKDASFETIEGISNQGYGNSSMASQVQGFVPIKSIYRYNEPKVENFQQKSRSYSHSDNQILMDNSQQPFQSESLDHSQFSYTAMEGRSSAGRPAHALATFGFGGKLLVMKNIYLGTNSAYGSQGATGGTISVLNLTDIIMEKSESSGIRLYNLNYFHSLYTQSIPGPLVGGSTTSKELNKWIDERIASCEMATMDARKEHLRLLISLLKISHQYYGKLRSPFGTDSSFLENDGPESAVTKLFTTSIKNNAHHREYGTLTHCMYNLPTEWQSQAIAAEVQNLLVSGKRKEALHCAQEGMLWGPALVLATQLGERFYIDTIKQMANCQFVSGSPIRTLCLLIAGQRADVFFDGASTKMGVAQQSGQVLANGMLNDWVENLAIIVANRTRDDEPVIMHLGDCLWKERGEVTAAHTCYLLAEANFESYSDSARLCLIGADHCNNPRTYASPEAIQRTEFYEYSRVNWNPQFLLLPFQPYKLIYAYMLAEVGKVSESSRYCQAILKVLKSSGHSLEVELWKTIASSLDERLQIHQQGGYGNNFVPAKLVGRFINTIDKSIHRMMGAPPPALPLTPENSVGGDEHDSLSMHPKVGGSQSSMAMTSLMTSASVEAFSEQTGSSNRNMHDRGVSEPDFGRSPKQDEANKLNNASSDMTSKTSKSDGSSRLSLFGKSFLQKTMEWVSISRSGRQAKLGETNKFYYDEKLKSWVEEGVEPPQEATPPPPVASFQNRVSDYNINTASKSQNSSPKGLTESMPPTETQRGSGAPPMPPSQNQFPRGRMGLRSRYVDTFNKGGGMVASSFQPPSQPTKLMGGAKFFVPAPVVASDTDKDASENIQEPSSYEDSSSKAPAVDSSLSSLSSSPLSNSTHQLSNMDDITPLRNKSGEIGEQNGDASIITPSRAASRSDSFSDPSNSKIHGSNTSVGKLDSPPHLLPGSPRNQTEGPQSNDVNSEVELNEVEL